MSFPASLRLGLLAGAVLIAACGDDSVTVNLPPEEKRPHDSRTFTPANPGATTFAAMAAAAGDGVDMSTTSRWAGVLNGAAYQVEVPANWNGKLVMYAHGYAGEGATLNVSTPSIRRHLIQNGYAWAASSYSTNYYDVRAGVEDTNALALAFNSIATQNGRPLPAPTRLYITGHSMGGHITAAAIEAETSRAGINKVAYHGAVPMCGVTGDTELFNQFGAMQVTAQALGGYASHPLNKWSEIQTQVTAALFTKFPSQPTAAGMKYLSVLQNLTGGPRPMFDLGIAFGGSFPSAWGTFGSDGTVSGILNRSVIDTTAYTYVIDGDPTGSAALNAAAQKWVPAPDANRWRTDGLRWIPMVHGEFKIPVVSIHTLGDLFVPSACSRSTRNAPRPRATAACWCSARSAAPATAISPPPSRWTRSRP